MSEDDFNFTDLGFGDRFVFVPANRGTTLTASDALNIVTANFPSIPNFIGDPFEIRHSSDVVRFNPPQIESVNNGDDIFMRFISEGNTFAFEVFANADGSMTDITIRNLLLDPADFAALILPVSYEDVLSNADIDLETMFGDFGFVLQNPFLGVDLTQNLDGAMFDGLSLFDGSLFGSLFDFGGGGDGGGFGFSFGFDLDFSFGSGGGGFDYRDGFVFQETDFSSLSLG
jgi:hypothetical protein